MQRYPQIGKAEFQDLPPTNPLRMIGDRLFGQYNPTDVMKTTVPIGFLLALIQEQSYKPEIGSQILRTVSLEANSQLPEFVDVLNFVSQHGDKKATDVSPLGNKMRASLHRDISSILVGPNSFNAYDTFRLKLNLTHDPSGSQQAYIIEDGFAQDMSLYGIGGVSIEQAMVPGHEPSGGGKRIAELATRLDINDSTRDYCQITSAKFRGNINSEIGSGLKLESARIKFRYGEEIMVKSNINGHGYFVGYEWDKVTVGPYVENRPTKVSDIDDDNDAIDGSSRGKMVKVDGKDSLVVSEFTGVGIKESGAAYILRIIAQRERREVQTRKIKVPIFDGRLGLYSTRDVSSGIVSAENYEERAKDTLEYYRHEILTAYALYPEIPR